MEGLVSKKCRVARCRILVVVGVVVGVEVRVEGLVSKRCRGLE